MAKHPLSDLISRAKSLKQSFPSNWRQSAINFLHNPVYPLATYFAPMAGLNPDVLSLLEDAYPKEAIPQWPVREILGPSYQPSQESILEPAQEEIPLHEALGEIFWPTPGPGASKREQSEALLANVANWLTSIIAPGMGVTLKSLMPLLFATMKNIGADTTKTLLERALRYCAARGITREQIGPVIKGFLEKLGRRNVSFAKVTQSPLVASAAKQLLEESIREAASGATTPQYWKITLPNGYATYLKTNEKGLIVDALPTGYGKRYEGNPLDTALINLKAVMAEPVTQKEAENMMAGATRGVVKATEAVQPTTTQPISKEWYISSPRATVHVKTSEKGIITEAAPYARKYEGHPLDALVRDLKANVVEPITAPAPVPQPKALAPINVYFGTGENADLSNLALRPFTYGNPPRKYYSVEHAYQTLKSGKFDKATYENPTWAKGGVKIAGKYPTNTAHNLTLMKNLIKASFEQNPDAMKRLLETEGAEFTHNQADPFWRREFPRLLKEVREELRTGKPAVPASPTAKATLQELTKPEYPALPAPQPHRFQLDPGQQAWQIQTKGGEWIPVVTDQEGKILTFRNEAQAQKYNQYRGQDVIGFANEIDAQQWVPIVERAVQGQAVPIKSTRAYVPGIYYVNTFTHPSRGVVLKLNPEGRVIEMAVLDPKQAPKDLTSFASTISSSRSVPVEDVMRQIHSYSNGQYYVSRAGRDNVAVKDIVRDILSRPGYVPDESMAAVQLRPSELTTTGPFPEHLSKHIKLKPTWDPKQPPLFPELFADKEAQLPVLPYWNIPYQGKFNMPERLEQYLQKMGLNYKDFYAFPLTKGQTGTIKIGKDQYKKVYNPDYVMDTFTNWANSDEVLRGDLGLSFLFPRPPRSKRNSPLTGVPTMLKKAQGHPFELIEEPGGNLLKLTAKPAHKRLSPDELEQIADQLLGIPEGSAYLRVGEPDRTPKYYQQSLLNQIELAKNQADLPITTYEVTRFGLKPVDPRLPLDPRKRYVEIPAEEFRLQSGIPETEELQQRLAPGAFASRQEAAMHGAQASERLQLLESPTPEDVLEELGRRIQLSPDQETTNLYNQILETGELPENMDALRDLLSEKPFELTSPPLTDIYLSKTPKYPQPFSPEAERQHFIEPPDWRRFQLKAPGTISAEKDMKNFINALTEVSAFDYPGARGMFGGMSPYRIPTGNVINEMWRNNMKNTIKGLTLQAANNPLTARDAYYLTGGGRILDQLDDLPPEFLTSLKDSLTALVNKK